MCLTDSGLRENRKFEEFQTEVDFGDFERQETVFYAVCYLVIHDVIVRILC